MQRLRKTLVVAAFSAALVAPAATAAALPLPLIPLLPGSAGAGSSGAGSAGAGAGSADQIPPGSAEQPQQQPQPQVAPTPDVGTERAQALAAVNAARGQQGCAPLLEDSRLAAAAQAHADDMAARGYFGHSSPEGAGTADRVAAAGYVPAQVAENLAAGQSAGADVVASWLGSEGHRATIVNCQLVDTGIGVGFGAQGPQWVQVFATP
ncbi:CAP domain-containing protein [Nocardia lasii]|uniref:CAP domain-containing protein n=1 Tax=Nocardia lasii TaxID=1616107 RepID=A0ABW1JWT8_9NOCA